MGSIDQVTTPLFQYDLATRPTLYHLSTYNLDTSAAHMRLRALLPWFANVLTELNEFSCVVEDTLSTRGAKLDTREFVDLSYSIQHQLLPHRDEGNEREVDDLVMGMVDEHLEEVFRLGAILYVKEILQEFTFSSTGNRIIVTELKWALGRLGDQVLVWATAGTWLLLWLHVVARIACGERIEEREWFVMHLRRTRERLGLHTGGDARSVLDRVLWVGKVLDAKGKTLWEEATAVEQFGHGGFLYDGLE